MSLTNSLEITFLLNNGICSIGIWDPQKAYLINKLEMEYAVSVYGTLKKPI